MDNFIGYGVNNNGLPGRRMDIPYRSIASGLVDGLDLLPGSHRFWYLLSRPTPSPHLTGNLISYYCTAT